MARTLLRKINQYSEEFKANGGGLSSLPGVRIQELKGESSFRLDELRSSKAAARQQHRTLLEKYSAADVANFVAYLGQVR